MKTNALNRKAFEHLGLIGYILEKPVEEMIDAPFVFIEKDQVTTCYSVTTFKASSDKLIQQEQVLKLRPINEPVEVKKMPRNQQDAHKLLSVLNSRKNHNVAGYDVSWSIQESSWNIGTLDIVPISPNACGSISMPHLELVLQFAKDHPWLHVSIGYTDWNNEKKRYGTSKPCISIS